MLWPTPNQSPAPGRPSHLEPSRRNNSPTSHSPPTTSSSRSTRSPHELRTFLARYSGVSPPAVRSSSPAVPILPLSTSGPGQPLTEAESDTMAVHPTWLTPPPSSDCHESVRTRNHKFLRYLWTPVAPLTLPPRRIPRLATVENLIESQRGKLTINGITPKMLSDWEARYPSVREADHINYEYDGSTSRMIIRCHVSPVHDSLQIYFKGRASVALIARLGDESFLENIQMSSGSSMIPLLSGVYEFLLTWKQASEDSRGNTMPSRISSPTRFSRWMVVRSRRLFAKPVGRRKCPT